MKHLDFLNLLLKSRQSMSPKGTDEVGSIPTAPTNVTTQSKQIGTLGLPVYLWRTLRLHERYRILLEHAPQVLLKLLLAGGYPRRVMSFSNPHAMVSKKHGDAFDGDSSQEQFHGKRVSHSVRVAAGNLR
jgi:hypothetical protein